MPLKKITENDLAGKGVRGQADVPGLSAEEMQIKVEEIVRDVVIPNINENVDNCGESFATKEEAEQVLLTAGSVTSVFGRAGSITAKAGDYTPEQVGAAPENTLRAILQGAKTPSTPSSWAPRPKSTSTAPSLPMAAWEIPTALC